MLAEPAAALGIPLRLLAEAPGRVGRPGDPRPHGGRLHRPRHTPASRRGLRGRHLRPRARPDRPPARARGGRHDRPPGPVGAGARPGQGRDARGAGGARCPDAALPRSSPTPTRSPTSVSRASSRPAGAGTTAGRSGSCGRRTSAAPAFAAAEATGVRILAEELVDFRRELSALVARSPSGQAAAYPVVESVQRDGICAEVVAPAPGLSDRLATQAQELALRIARELDVTGILAVELFETDDDRILVNELAMRPHNTGHWTQDGAVTSQFENHLRAVLDLPLGSPVARAPWTVMVNILGGPDRLRRPAVRRVPARLRPRPAAARASLRQGAPSRPQGRARQCLRRRPARVSRTSPPRRCVVRRRVGRRE